jgi:excinuclease ABC subunit B
VLSSVYERDYVQVPLDGGDGEVFRSQAELDARIAELHRDMRQAAANLDFEKAAALRDRLKALRTRDLGLSRVAVRS